MDEGTRTSSSPATEWAASASERDYARNRHELDALVIASVPDYEATIRRELDDFDAAVTAAHVRYKQKYGGPAKYARWLQHTLLWTSLLCVLFAFAFVFPTGGRSGNHATITASLWNVMLPAAAVLFVVGVGVQLASAARFGIHPHQNLEIGWLPTALGTLMVPGMLWLVSSKDLDVDRTWIAITAAGVLASAGYTVVWVSKYRRTPQSARQPSDGAKLRSRELRLTLVNLTEHRADRIEQAFDALPPELRARLREELDAATEVLRERGLIRHLLKGEGRLLRQDPRPGHRPMVPGFLLLEHRSAAHRALYRSRGRFAPWIVGEYAPEVHPA